MNTTWNVSQTNYGTANGFSLTPTNIGITVANDTPVIIVKVL